MRGNNILIAAQQAAVAGAKTLFTVAALTIMVGIPNVFAQQGGTFENRECSGATTCALSSTGILSDTAVTDLNHIHVPKTDGVLYASELFGSGAGTTQLPEGQKAAVVYTVDGEIRVNFDIIFTLSNGAAFVANPVLVLMSNTDTTGITIGTPSLTGQSVTFRVEVTPSAGQIIRDGAQFGLLYNFSGATALSTPGEEITMTAALQTKLNFIDQAVNPSREVTIASSSRAIDVQLSPELSGEAFISVSSDSKEFTGTSLPGGGGVYMNSSEVRIGYLALQVSDKVKQKDGTSAFALSDTGTSAAGSTLVIENCQCAASRELPGKIYIQAGSGINGEVDEEGLSATWTFDNTALQNIITTTTNSDDNKGAAIIVKVDQSTQINIPEDPPLASAEISFTTAGADIITDEAELRKTRRDGMNCTIFNVPPTNATDILSIRITNDSGVAGTVRGTMYALDGTALFVAQDLNNANPIAAGETIRISSQDLEAIAGTWTGRATLEISSSLPRLEVLALLRERLNPAAPLTNLSLGAHGDSCDPVHSHP